MGTFIVTSKVPVTKKFKGCLYITCRYDLTTYDKTIEIYLIQQFTNNNISTQNIESTAPTSPPTPPPTPLPTPLPTPTPTSTTAPGVPPTGEACHSSKCL